MHLCLHVSTSCHKLLLHGLFDPWRHPHPQSQVSQAPLCSTPLTLSLAYCFCPWAQLAYNTSTRFSTVTLLTLTIRLLGKHCDPSRERNAFSLTANYMFMLLFTQPLNVTNFEWQLPPGFESIRVSHLIGNYFFPSVFNNDMNNWTLDNSIPGTHLFFLFFKTQEIIFTVIKILDCETWSDSTLMKLNRCDLPYGSYGRTIKNRHGPLNMWLPFVNECVCETSLHLKQKCLHMTGHLHLYILCDTLKYLYTHIRCTITSVTAV